MNRKGTRKGARLQTKLLGMVVCLVSISLVVGGMTYLGFSRSEEYLNEITSRSIPHLRLVDEIEFQTARARRYEKELFLFSSITPRTEYVLKKRAGYLDELTQEYRTVGASISRLGTGDHKAVSAREASLQRELKNAFDHTQEMLAPLTDALMANRSFTEVSDLYGPYKASVRELETSVKTLRDEVLAGVAQKQAEATRFTEDLSRLLLAVGVLVVVLLPLIGFLLAHRVGGAMKQLMEGIRGAASGRFEPIVVRTRDEFAEIAATFNDTMGQLQDFIRTEEERAAEQRSLIAFLEVVSDASEGDLTAKAPVTADAFGSIADAYNLMVDSLADLLTDTSGKAQEVGSEARRLLEIFREMEAGADTQADQVKQATAAVSQVSEMTLDVGEKVNLAQEATARVDRATSQGNARVQQNIEGMQLIRVTVQVINKKMKSLSERLLEIGTISQLISEVATRTTILAMNASIEAARAGDQGRGFLVISDEIKRLADKSAEATKQIGGIIKAIQTEAGEVTAALEEETRTVEEQTQLAQSTGEAFQQIQEATRGSREVVGEIFGLSRKQQGLTGETVRAMAQVSSISEAILKQVKASSRISDGLNAMSQNLLGSLSQFRLPEGGDPQAGSVPALEAPAPQELDEEPFQELDDSPGDEWEDLSGEWEDLGEDDEDRGSSDEELILLDEEFGLEEEQEKEKAG